MSDIASRGIISRQQTTKALIGLHGSAGWSAALLFTYGINRLSHDLAQLMIIFSSPEQRSQRAIVLPPASTLALASTNVKFYVKFLGPHYFQTLWWIWFMFGMMMDTGPKFYTVPSTTPIHDLKVKVTDLELLCYLVISKLCGIFFFMFGMMIDASPNFYVVRSPTQYMTLRSRSRT